MLVVPGSSGRMGKGLSRGVYGQEEYTTHTTPVPVLFSPIPSLTHHIHQPLPP